MSKVKDELAADIETLEKAIKVAVGYHQHRVATKLGNLLRYVKKLDRVAQDQF